jgi:hypothetical protein
MSNGMFGSWRKSSYSAANGSCVEVAFTGWRMSSHSGGNGNCVEVASTDWHTSSHSDGNGDCVQIATAEGTVGMRDSKQDGRGPVLEFDGTQWSKFIRATKNGEFDL